MSPSSVSAPPAAVPEFLLQRINFERTPNIPYQTVEFKLDRMRRLMTLLGDPQLGVKAIHIAGTKGKGSTAAMVASILSAAGYRTGLYTSPHLERIEERIKIDGQPCSSEELADLAAAVQPAVEALDREATDEVIGPTFFEVTTAMAFVYFARMRVDMAVLEVGLGGRLDSTNVCCPELCIITSISFDHTKQLGNTLAAIAREKAGIMKTGVPMISGVIESEPRQVIVEHAAAVVRCFSQRGAHYDFSRHQAETSSSGECLDYREPADSPRCVLHGLEIPMWGGHQAANAAAAVAAFNRLRERGWSIEDAAIYEGLRTARCPARAEQVASSPCVVLDVAHNVASIRALFDVLQERFPRHRRLVIFASSKDKDYAGMLQIVAAESDVLILTQYLNNPRAMEPEALFLTAQALREESASNNQPRRPVLHVTVRPADALRLARLMVGSEDLICITGSFFLAAELRPLAAR